MTNQLSWNDRLRHSLAIERESDAFDRRSDDDSESTYWTRDDVERLHCEFAQRLLRIVPEEVVEQLGGQDGPPGLGIVRRDFSEGDTIEQGVVRIIAGTIQLADGKPYLPARGPIAPAEWVQLNQFVSAAVRPLAYTKLGGSMHFFGHKLRLLYVVEPKLTDFQSNAVFIPPAGYFDMACNWVHGMLTAADKFPIGRA